MPHDGDGTPHDDGVERPLDEDAAWREIVSNYGDRAELDDTDADAPDDLPKPSDLEDPGRTDAGDTPTSEGAQPMAEPAGGWFAIEPIDLDGDGPTDRYQPPVPPPLPKPSPGRLAAWLGVLGAPVFAILVVVLRSVTDLPIPGWVVLGLVAAFLGGFGYLIATMPKDPGDPWDDGARV